MLHKDPFVISPATFTLIQDLQRLPELQDFYLVRGTALALQLGHRNSIDIDLFTFNKFNPQELASGISDHFTITLSMSKKNAMLPVVNGIKTDCIRHNYPLIKQPITEEQITFLSLEDIAAMKLYAVTNSGKRVKDFIDIYFLLEHFSLSEMLKFYEIKYPNFNSVIALKAINYFEDIDVSIDPPKLRQPLPFNAITKRINSAVLHSHQKF